MTDAELDEIEAEVCNYPRRRQLHTEDVLALVAEVRRCWHTIGGLRRGFGLDPHWDSTEAEAIYEDSQT